VPNAGVEFILATKASVSGDSSLVKAEALQHAAITKLVQAVYSGYFL